MTSADANRAQLSYAFETTYGTALTGANYQTLRLTGESLKYVPEHKTSEELRSDRQIADLIHTGVKAEGSINGELSYGTYDDLFLAALCETKTGQTWETLVTSTEATYAAVASGNKFTDSGSAFVSDGFLSNQWVRVSGFTGASTTANGIFKTGTIIAGEMPVTHGATLIDDAEGEDVTIEMGAYIENGTNITQGTSDGRSMTIERAYLDVGSDFAIYKGMMVDGMSLNIGTSDIVTVGFDFLGSDEDSDTSAPGTGYDAATTSEILNAINNVEGMFENGTSIDLTGVNFNLKNNLRDRMKIGTLGAFEIGSGTVGVEGGFQGYYSGGGAGTTFARYLANTSTDFAVVFNDGNNADPTANNYYVFEFPQAKFSDGGRVAGGINTDIIQDMKFSCYRDSSELVTMRIARFPSA